MITIYCIKNDNKEIIYVGKTKNFKRRTYEHRYKKHIPKTYTFEIIEECAESEANAKETYYIKKYDTVNNGLNITYGEGSTGIKGTGILSRFKKGNELWKNRKTKKVKCIENGNNYNNAMECADDLGINRDGVQSVCNGSRKSYKKYHFEYID